MFASVEPLASMEPRRACVRVGYDNAAKERVREVRIDVIFVPVDMYLYNNRGVRLLNQHIQH